MVKNCWGLFFSKVETSVFVCSETEEEEAQDSPGPAVTPKEFDPDVSGKGYFVLTLKSLEGGGMCPQHFQRLAVLRAMR